MVTALYSERRDHVRVELDGAPWRTFPAAAVAAAGLARGVELDRVRARTLRRAARRAEALERAAAALDRRERSTSELDGLLLQQGVAASERQEALATLGRLGYLDDRRVAHRRAEVLADRGYGDQAILDELERRQLDRVVAAEALALLPVELDRARKLTAGLTAAKAVRRLVQKGFSEETIETICGTVDGFTDE